MASLISSTPAAGQYAEPYRPQFHFSPPQGWMNDPNGLVFYEGEYHLFFQFNPASLTWGSIHWGHAVSPDLVHWENLPVALVPDAHGDIYSGSVIVDAQNTSGLVPGGGLLAFFSYSPQTQGVAASTDRGRTWKKYAGNPIIPALRHDFRDPKVFWHEVTQQWIMVLAAGQAIMIMTSRDLIHWEVASEFTGSYTGGGVWEVPDLFPLAGDGLTKWVMIVSINPGGPAGGSGTRYHIGEFDGKTFTDDNPGRTLWLDYGPDNYAGTTWSSAPDQRRIFTGWMNNWTYADRIPTSPWRGAATLPRELSLRRTPGGIRLVQTPPESLRQIRQPIGRWADIPLTGERSFDGLQGQRLEMIAEFEIGTATTFGLTLYGSGDDSTRVAYVASQQQLVVQRPSSGIGGFFTIFSAPLVPEDNRIRLHLFLDRSSVEVFAHEGLVSLTSQVFPQPDSRGITLFAHSGTVRLRSLEAYTLRSIWGTPAP